MKKEIEVCDACGKETAKQTCPICERNLCGDRSRDTDCVSFNNTSQYWYNQNGASTSGVDVEICGACIKTINRVNKTEPQGNVALMIASELEPIYKTGHQVLIDVLKRFRAQALQDIASAKESKEASEGAKT